jgi:nucleotide-binding universal stress UspA family protein
MYKRILLGTDGSSASTLALKQAVTIAKAFSARLRIVNVIDRYSYDESWWVSPSAFEQILENMRKHAREILAEAQTVAEEADLQVEVAVLEIDEGPARISQRILQEAAAWHADLMVLGTHGRRGMDRLVLGSVAEGVVRAADAPVLLVRGA